MRSARKNVMHAVIAGLFVIGGAAHAEPVVLTGGWVTDFSPAMADPSNRTTVVFQFEGSYKMGAQGRGEKYFLATCVGMESSIKVKPDETVTKGSGRCEFKDKDGDRLLARMETEFDGFTLRFDGGTGKWASSSGTVVSKEQFTLEGERQLKGYSNAKGDISFGK